jgi:hypothetical protein
MRQRFGEFDFISGIEGQVMNEFTKLVGLVPQLKVAHARRLRYESIFIAPGIRSPAEADSC